MGKSKEMLQGYMSVGDLAKRMGTTVRTLQYYDKEGLLSPSSESAGGRRLYTDKDMIKLHQILSLKSLGFSLDDIKNRLISLDTPEDVANALTEQAAAIQEKMKSLSEALAATELLKAEVLQIQSVDFKKYADIIMNIRMKNEFYWLIKHFDDKTLNQFRNRYDMDNGLAMMGLYSRLLEKAVALQEAHISPESEEGQSFAKEYWDMIIEVTRGDKNMLSKLMELGDCKGPDNQWTQLQEHANAFIEPALGTYFASMNYNPFEEE